MKGIRPVLPFGPSLRGTDARSGRSERSGAGIRINSRPQEEMDEHRDHRQKESAGQESGTRKMRILALRDSTAASRNPPMASFATSTGSA